MPLHEDEIRRILDAYISGRATPEEIALLNTFFREHKDAVDQEILRKEEYALLQERIYSGISRRIQPARPKRSYRATWVAAASVTLILAISIVYFLTPGNVPHTASREIPIITRTTSKGQKLMLGLPDGTTVKLNANSSLSFPGDFSGSVREVVLSGEAFFEVTHDPSMPFVVKTPLGSTKVLGTSFNVKSNSYKTEVTLVTGKVDVSNDEQHVLLMPDQHASIKQDEAVITVATVDVSKYTEWKDNIISFDDEPLSDVVRELEDWYGVEIKVSNPDLGSCRITGRYDNESLENVLESFRFMLKGSYTMNGTNITLSGKGCR